MGRIFRIFLSVASGILLSLPWLGFPGWVLFIAFFPLLLLDDYFLRNRDRYKSVSFWSHSFLAFLVWNGATTWWILHATPAGALAAILLNSFFMSLVFWLAHIVRRRTAGSLGYLAFLFFWISFEYIHYNWDIEWPWLTLGNGFANNVAVIQWYEHTGVLGGSLWIWLVTLFLFSLLKLLATGGEMRRIILNGAILFIVIVVPAGWSGWSYHTFTEAENPRKVLIIQPNIDPYSETFDDGAVNDKIMKFIRLTESNLEPDVQYIIGPETVFEQNWKEDLLMAIPAFGQVQALTSTGASLVIGATTYRIYDDTSTASATARRSRDGMVYDVYNAALFTDPSGGYQIYHKSILVPGVEKMPYRKYLKFLENFIIDLGGTSGSLGVQEEATNFLSPSGDQIATSICYESAFGGYVAQFIRKGAGMIFVITNDGWWKNTPGYKQHFSFSRLRAIETRRYVVRSANTGISGIINQRGDIVEKSEWWTEAAIIGTVNYNEALTFYVKNGDYIGRILSFFSVLMLLSVVSTSIVRGKKKPHRP